MQPRSSSSSHHRELEEQRRLHRRQATQPSAHPGHGSGSLRASQRCVGGGEGRIDSNDDDDDVLERHLRQRMLEERGRTSGSHSPSPPASPHVAEQLARQRAQAYRVARAQILAEPREEVAQEQHRAPVAANRVLDVPPRSQDALQHLATPEGETSAAPSATMNPTRSRSRSLALYHQRKKQQQGAAPNVRHGAVDSETLVMSPPREPCDAPAPAASVGPRDHDASSGTNSSGHQGALTPGSLQEHQRQHREQQLQRMQHMREVLQQRQRRTSGSPRRELQPLRDQGSTPLDDSGSAVEGSSVGSPRQPLHRPEDAASVSSLSTTSAPSRGGFPSSSHPSTTGAHNAAPTGDTAETQRLRAQNSALREQVALLNSASRRDRSEVEALKRQLIANDEELQRVHEAHEAEVVDLQRQIAELGRRGRSTRESSPVRVDAFAQQELSPQEIQNNSSMEEALAIAEEQLEETTAALHCALASLTIGEEEAAARLLLSDEQQKAFVLLTHRFIKQLANLHVTSVSGTEIGRVQREREALERRHEEEKAALVELHRSALAAELHSANEQALRERDEEIQRVCAEAEGRLSQAQKCGVRLAALSCARERSAANDTWENTMRAVLFNLWCALASHSLRQKRTDEEAKHAAAAAAAAYEKELSSVHQISAACQQHLEECVLIEKQKVEQLEAELQEAEARHQDELRSCQKAHEAAVAAARADTETRFAERVTEAERRAVSCEERAASASERAELLCESLIAADKALHVQRVEAESARVAASVAAEHQREAMSRLRRLSRQRDAVLDHIHTLRNCLGGPGAGELPLTAPSGSQRVVRQGSPAAAPLFLPSICISCTCSAAVARRLIFTRWLIHACSGRREKLSVLRSREAELRAEVQRWHSMGVVAVDTPASHPNATQYMVHRLPQQPRSGSVPKTFSTSCITTAGPKDVAVSPTRAVSPMRTADPPVSSSTTADATRASEQNVQELMTELRTAMAEDKKTIRRLKEEAARFRQVIQESNEAYAELLSCSEVWYAELQRLRSQHASVASDSQGAADVVEPGGLEHALLASTQVDAYDYDEAQRHAALQHRRGFTSPRSRSLSALARGADVCDARGVPVIADTDI